MESVRIRTTVADLVDFTMYCSAASPQLRRARHLRMTIAPAFIFMIATIFYLYTEYAAIAIQLWVLSLVMCGINYLTYDWQRRRWLTRLYRNKATAEGEESVLEVDSAGIRLQSKESEGSMKWSAVENIVADEHRGYFLTGVMQGIIVTREGILEGDFDEFMERANDYWKDAAGDE